MAAKTGIEHYLRSAIKEGLYPGRALSPKSRRGDLVFHLETLFEGVDFDGKRFLDVGGGAGLYSFYAACRGAREVVCLEPEAEGSTAGVGVRFHRVREILAYENTRLEPLTFQAYEPGGETFDAILLHNSINHLDETACIHLLEGGAAKAAYEKIFAKLGSLAARGAKLIVCDCSRKNFFADLGLKNPTAPAIEWHKHQAPEAWADLLGQAGFTSPRIRWTSFYQFRRPGRLFLGNRLAAYFLQSHFCLTMVKA